jgi:tRNA pseudouridine55 synthase
MDYKDFETGETILVDKPLRWTSFDVVGKIRNTIKVKKVGHAGTLDPLATGLLVICTGKKTKTIDSYQALYKEYTGSFEIGATTPSHDLETEVVKGGDISKITLEQVKAVAQTFVGLQDQIPPMHSAIQVDGVRLYKLARKGQEIEIKPRAIELFEFEITSFESPQVYFRIKCSKGTYIRSIARDFGERLSGVGAYLSSLRRTKIGELNVDDAISMEDFVARYKVTKTEI